MRIELMHWSMLRPYCYIRNKDQQYFNGDGFQDDPYALPMQKSLTQEGTFYLEIDENKLPDGTYLIQTYEADYGNRIGEDTFFIMHDGKLMPSPAKVVYVDHNYGGKDNLRFVDESGNGIGYAFIKCWLKSDYEKGDYDKLIAWTMTMEDGRWVAPLQLAAGYDYVLIFSKPPEAAETRIDITV